MPVWARSGPGGGYVQDARATLAPVNLTPAQAIAVATALATQPDAPYAADGRVALEKVLDVMAPADRRRVEELGTRIWIRAEGSPPPVDPALARCLGDALATRRVVVLTYDDAAGRSTRRRVEPHLLARRGEHWYLVGWCRERRGPRWFRFDRVRAAHLTPEPVVERDAAVFGTPPDDATPSAVEGRWSTRAAPRIRWLTRPPPAEPPPSRGPGSRSQA